MRSKALLIGQAPSRTSDPARPFSGASGRKLALWAGVDDLADAFDLRNVISLWPGKNANGKGDRFPIRTARRNAEEILRGCAEGDRIVLVGRNVARAFLVGQYSYFAEIWVPVFGGFASAWIVPHPSGVNRVLNDPLAVVKIRALLRNLAA